ncbi:MAG: hypothetical protein U0528_14720 [Anaerolineae bacterium]|nr:hypothetical protein [Anaerolineae bacterium]
MGRLLTIHPCSVCNYHVEDELHEGGSGSSTLFLHNHYVLALCNNCHHLVSVLAPNTAQETQDALRTARSEIVQLEADAVLGDLRAKDMLPFFRDALDNFREDDPPVATILCTNCGSDQVEMQPIEGNLFDEQDAWVHCPRCEEGRLLVETTGQWS